MIETNIRILAPGMEISVPVRRVRVRGTTNTPVLREKVCYRLRQDRTLICVPCQDSKDTILVVTNDPFPPYIAKVDGWSLNLTDSGEMAYLDLTTAEGRHLMPELIERMMTHAIQSRALWWTSESLRIWYEDKPFLVKDGIRAYRRYHLSVLYIEGEGLGVAIDVETAFFTVDSVADFFVPRVPQHEQALECRRRRERFEILTRRQKGQHGTLLYNNGISAVNCYFENMADGKTCSNTGMRKVKRKEYPSLISYYNDTNPALRLRPETPVAMVSFQGLDCPQPVAANLLWIRVMNDELPAALSQVDKIVPLTRRGMILDFWHLVGDLRFAFVSRRTRFPVPDPARTRTEQALVEIRGTGATAKTMKAPGQTVMLLDDPEEVADWETAAVQECLEHDNAGTFLPGLWRPTEAQLRVLAFPMLSFGENQTLSPPNEISAAAYQAHYKKRLALIEEAGAYQFPPLMERSLIALYPENADLCHATEAMMEGICERLQTLTGRPFDFQLISYASIQRAAAELARERQGATAVFILNDEAEAYSAVAHCLKGWRVKRVTHNTLEKKHRDLIQGTSSHGANIDKRRGKRSWDSFLRMTALDVLQVMDGVPFRIDRAGKFEAQLVIDVSYDRKHYALSLLIAREEDKHPDFRLVSHVERKPDDKNETINGTMLRDDIVAFISRYIVIGRDSPLASLLVARDGHMSTDECNFIAQAIRELKRLECLTAGAHVETAELHKKTEMHVRMWEVDEHEEVTNVLEGTALRLSATNTILATTGSGTLRQGTADPMLIVVPEGSDAIDEVTEALGAAAHLNWSSPEVAQRLPMPFKRTDDVLKARSEQEIRRIR